MGALGFEGIWVDDLTSEEVRGETFMQVNWIRRLNLLFYRLVAPVKPTHSNISALVASSQFEKNENIIR